MTDNPPRTALGEWRRYGLLPVAAGIGYSTIAIQTFGIGPFVAPLEQEFGWSRAEIMIGLTISNAIGVLFNFAVGVMADRLGPRRVGLTGIVIKTTAIMLLASAAGTVLNWALLWVLVAFGAVLLQANIWASAVTGRFDKGRGLAIAVALSGSSFCAAIIPVLATWLIDLYGWRMAFVGIGLVWLVLAFPIVFFLFHGVHDEKRRRAKSNRDVVTAEIPGAAAAGAVAIPGVTIREGLRMRAFWSLTIASFAFAFYTMAISPNLVPMLTDKGSSAVAAAQIAALVGIVGVVARISAGFLLDHVSARLLGTGVFLLPVIGCALMLGDNPSQLYLILGVISFGVTIGAEYDVVLYLVSRHFGLRSFASLMGGMLTAGAAGAAIAPALAGFMYDVFGSYDEVLMFLMVLMAAGATAIAAMGRPTQNFAVAGH